MYLFPELSVLITYIGACVLLQTSPGPDMMLIVSNSIGRGTIAGLITVFGIFLGVLVQAPVLSLGTVTLISAYEHAFDILQGLGAIYLGYLSYKNFRAFFDNRRGISIDGNFGARSNVIVEGFVTNITNPKVILFLFAFIPQFAVPEKGHLGMQILILLLILKVNGLFVNGSTAILSSYISRRLSGGKLHTHWSSLLSGIVFLMIAVFFWIQLIIQ